MTDIENDSLHDVPPTSEMSAVSQPTRGLRVLSVQEVGAVAGGPEGEVGNGMSPPR